MRSLLEKLKKVKIIGWTIDPKTGSPSVSLTLMLASYIVLVTVALLQVAGVVTSLSIFEQLFWACASLYFGRKLSDKPATPKKE